MCYDYGVEGKRFKETRPFNTFTRIPKRIRPMPTDLSTIDLATINAAHVVIVASIRHKVCQWEQESSDLAADGNLSTAVMVKHWAFAADLLSTTISTEFT
ncbi:MAG: hypothetical protein ACI90Z_001527, partial [Cyanobium sp.]